MNILRCIALWAMLCLATTLARSYSRKERAEKRNVLQGIYPGTKWCGLNDIASSPTDLGEKKKTDICCRAHDNECSIRMRPFQYKYHVRNWTPKVISRCNCEIRFKNCLLQAGTSASKSLFNIYFYIIKPSCIRLKPYTYKKCIKRDWWGRCTKSTKVHSKKAVFYDLHEAVDI